MFRRFEGEQRFKHIFNYKRDLGEGLKSLRIILRPLLKITGLLDGFLIFMRNTGQAVNFKFPEEAPVQRVTSCPKEYLDHLSYSDSDGVFPLPDSTPVLAGVSENLSEGDRAVIEQNCQLNEAALGEYRGFVKAQFERVFTEAGLVAQQIDALLNFYCDLYG